MVWKLLKSGMQKDETDISDQKCSLWIPNIPKFNPQNDKVLAANSEDIPEDMLTVYFHQKPTSVVVWAEKNLEIFSDFCETGCQSQHNR